MGMFINTNVAAINAQRNLNVTGGKMSKALEQLSSGLRINRAADDAAGLAISEKMRSQIRGMQMGLRNAQDGVSMIQTAEGALNETHAILQRMRELTVQAGSTILSVSDRESVGEELLTLRNELDNIASRSRFNGLNLLTGSLSVTTATAGGAIADTGAATTAIDVSKAEAGVTYALTSAGNNLTVTNGTTNVAQTITAAAMGGSIGDTQVLNFDALGVKFTVTQTGAGAITAAEVVLDIGVGADVVTTGQGNATFRVGSETTDNVTVGFSDLRASALGGTGTTLTTLVADNTAVGTTTLADALLGALDTAISQVSTQRAKLGAAQNQMESAINSVAVSVENLSASESRIRDADIAMVSSELVTRQIMQQAGVSVLAQANQSPQAVLSLLQ
ncbi:MAG: flagellin [Chloroflexi bacterium]|nr:flagellin [Chloroflexota bacterium]MDA1145489.1 flagellin [Chloroflexota bacterium]